MSNKVDAVQRSVEHQSNRQKTTVNDIPAPEGVMYFS